MSSASIASSRRPISRDYDTGFPDSLAARTTSLRHPEANTAPDACISAEDIDPAKALNRHRKSFLHHKYKRTISHGFITSEKEQEYFDSKEGLGSIDSAIDMGESKALVEGEGNTRPSKDGTASIDRTDGSFKGSHEPTTPTKSQIEQMGDSPRRRSDFFRKLRGQKH
ncbi:hypothetical protein BJ170DRAFT_591673 [Xylariales sp. AK1849]|nr:hypothetical protein BJ170DRAFT_591673 [Xylariales sp. AK1849]